jgi:hypothetical protein
MVYFTVYLNNLNNGTGYVDTALADDQLVRDFLQFLDIGVKAHKATLSWTPPTTTPHPGGGHQARAESPSASEVEPEKTAE